MCVNAAKDSDEWEHEVDIVPPIVGKDAVLGCNGLGEACPVGRWSESGKHAFGVPVLLAQ